jgi:hypothetical protein
VTVRIITDSNGRKHITNEPLLHQPAPVREPDHSDELTIAYMSGVHRGKELAAQRQWVGLTDEAIWSEYQTLWPFHPAEEPRMAKDIAKFARAIEAKLKEKNT